MSLRQYQKDILNALWKSLKTNDKVLLSAPTGSGKTVMASAFIDYVVKQNKRIAFVVDRIELVKQSRDTFGADKVSIIKAGAPLNAPAFCIFYAVLLSAAKSVKIYPAPNTTLM